MMKVNNNMKTVRSGGNEIILLDGVSKSPTSKYCTLVQWENGFEKWKLCRFATPMDGSCLFHCIANSFFEPYHTETFNGNHISRQNIIKLFRSELAEKLSSKISDDNDTTYYQYLNAGNTASFAEYVPEFKLDYMKSQLNSNNQIGYGYMEFISMVLDKDIYILDAVRHDIYVTDELPFMIKGNRSSIVIYYINGHYELVGINIDDKTFLTHFSPNHSFIKFLYDRVQQIIE